MSRRDRVEGEPAAGQAPDLGEGVVEVPPAVEDDVAGDDIDKPL
jgi:hypothetical protein